MRGSLIFNPMAGRFPSQPLVERAAKILTANGWDIRLLKTRGGDHITKLAKRAARDEQDAVFIAGGDGSVHKAIAGLLGSDTCLGVLPSGTANVWAQELGLPTLSWTNWAALEQSVKKILNGRIYEMDVGLCQGIPFLLWGGAGFDAFVVHHLEPRTRWQKQFPATQYAANVAWYARNWSGMELEIWADGEKLEGTFILALVTNIHLYAGGLAEISPSAKLDDGRMDLWLFSGDSMLETLQHLFDVAAGKHMDSEKTILRPCQEIRIRSNTDIYLQLDGEPVQPSSDVRISIVQGGVRVMVPDQLPRALFMKDPV